MHCLFCESSEIIKAPFPRSTYFNNKKFNYYKCKECGLVFIDPIPSIDDYAKMYAKSYHDQFYFKEINGDYLVLNKLLKKDGIKKTLLDYGCGDGSLLNYFSQRGYTCSGIEYKQELVEKLRKKFENITFYTVDEFEQTNNNLEYGIIYIGDVLEHIGNPVELIKRFHSNLKENGLILIQGPLENNFSLALGYRKCISLLKLKKTASHIPYHLSFSNAKNQVELFKKCGFKTLYYKIYETPWPYPDKLSINPILFIKWMVARISIFISKIFLGKFGNRFIYLGKNVN